MKLQYLAQWNFLFSLKLSSPLKDMKMTESMGCDALEVCDLGHVCTCFLICL